MEPIIDRMSIIIDNTACGKHSAQRGLPCWGITTSAGLGLGAVCNFRAKKAGFFASISQKSLLKSSKK